MAERFPHTTIQCIAALAQHHQLPINPERLIEDYALVGEEPPKATVLRIASDIGLKAKHEKLSWENLLAQNGVFPLIARMSDKTCMIVVGVTDQGGTKVAVLNPQAANATEVHLLDRETFTARWQGEVFFMKRLFGVTEQSQPFGLRWFIPEILKQKSALRDIAITALTMHVLALASPMFFQLVIDKVMVHQSVSTLWVLGVGIDPALANTSLWQAGTR